MVNDANCLSAKRYHETNLSFLFMSFFFLVRCLPFENKSIIRHFTFFDLLIAISFFLYKKNIMKSIIYNNKNDNQTKVSCTHLFVLICFLRLFMLNRVYSFNPFYPMFHFYTSFLAYFIVVFDLIGICWK